VYEFIALKQKAEKKYGRFRPYFELTLRADGLVTKLPFFAGVVGGFPKTFAANQRRTIQAHGTQNGFNWLVTRTATGFTVLHAGTSYLLSVIRST
jgi:hypothetical protein